MRKTLVVGLTVLVMLLPTIATAQPQDDFDVWGWVNAETCMGGAIRSGTDIEVWTPDYPEGELQVVLAAPGDSWSIEGPATFAIVHRTPKQVDWKTFTVPGGCDVPETTTTTTLPPDTTTTTSTTLPEVTTTTEAPPDETTTTTTPPETTTTTTEAPPVTTTTEAPPPPELPVTGLSLEAIGGIGAALLLIGWAIEKRTRPREN